jgi:cytochrome c oxidase subunit 1
MAIETRPESTQAPGGGDPGATPRERAWWLRPNIFTAIVGAAVGYALGRWLGNFMTPSFVATGGGAPDSNDEAIVLGYAFLIIGWLIGLGVFNDLVRQMLGRPLNRNIAAFEGHETTDGGIARYFRFTLDHKVVGLQYLIGMLIYFFTGGLLAMAIRTELLSPSYHVMSPTMYLQVVGEHGTMMMMMLTSVILGPFGNYLVPLMIGSKRVAFPRIEALSFWLTPCAYLILLSSFLDGGFPTGWTGYAPLSVQAGEGMDGYAVAFGLMGISVILAGFNMIITIICYRAPGMRWSRLPMFVWAMLTTAFLLVLAAPVLVGGMYMIVTDRTAQTAFFVDQLGGSSYLYEDLFWFFGHPEVYILALPGFGIVNEIIPVFARKPLFGYKVGAAGMFGVAILSFFVWQHHLFDSGMDPDMRPLFMLTTELISIPTGFIYLVAMGTFWKSKLRLTVPMLFAIALFFNFLFGGISGVFLSDVPADTTAHGSFFVMAHFHYTIMGGLIFAFFGGIYYWLPKVMGVTLNERLGKIHFWTMFLAFNSTFMPLFAAGLLGQPRRVFEYAANLQTLNDWVSISAFCLGGSLCIFIFNFVMSTVVWRKQAPQNPWQARGLEWQVPSPPPADNFEHIPVVLAGPYEYGDPNALPVADLHPPAGVISGALAPPVVSTGAAIGTGELGSNGGDHRPR